MSRNVTELLTRAETAYRTADGNLWQFAEYAHEVVGLRNGATADLASRIRRSTDVVEGYACAWTLWCDLLGPYNSHAEEWRESLYVSHWVSVGRKYKSEWISLTDAANLLQCATAEGWTVEMLRIALPHEDRGDMKRDAKRLIRTLDKKFINAPALDVDGRQYAKVRRAAVLLRGRLEELG